MEHEEERSEGGTASLGALDHDSLRFVTAAQVVIEFKHRHPEIGILRAALEARLPDGSAISLPPGTLLVQK